MKDNIISINLGASTAPIVTEVRGRDYIEYGTDDWRNLYPQFLIDLYYSSSTHSAIINATAEMIAGEDLIAEESDNLEAFVKLQKFIAHPNSKESLHSVIKKVAFDFKLQGGYALNIVWSQDRTQIAEIYHIPVERVRAGRPNELGRVDTYYVSADWANLRGNRPYPIPAFNVNDRTSPSQLLYTGSYSPNMDIYHTPDYIAGCNWALVDQRVAEFHLNNISNGFSGSYFISFANGVPTQEERFQIEQSLAEKFTGSDNAGKFILTFSDDKTRTPEITPIAVADQDKLYLSLQELLVQNILTAHRVTSPMLMGIKSDTGLGSNVNELNAAAEFYNNTVVRPFQQNILKTLKLILEVNQMNLPLEFVQLKPITTKWSAEDLKEVLTEDELREELGLKPLKEEEVVADEFSSEKTELELFIEEFGEDINEDWELIEEEVVDGEHQEFDFEEVLNDLAGEKIELASTGRAIPSRKSEQDGISKKTYDYFRVRYVYTKDEFLSQKGKTREFCRIMMGAKKLYRKEDIINMGSKVVNAGWGPKGANTYSIWLDKCSNSLNTNKLELYKGGGNCHHFWLRQIFKTVIGESRTTKIEDADMIGYTKAKSEGFTAKKNDNKVAKPPKKMKNNGFLKPR
jgi:hypothetical protein